MKVNEVDLYCLIKTRQEEGSSLEELAKEFKLQIGTIQLLLADVPIQEPEIFEVPYDNRTNSCGTCGSALNGDGLPVHCTGDCQHTEAEYYNDDYPESAEGDPIDLNFEEY